MPGRVTRSARRVGTSALLTAVLGLSLGGCVAAPNYVVDPGILAVSELHNDLRTPVGVTLCGDARCAARSATVASTLAPGGSVAVWAPARGGAQPYGVFGAGPAVRCLTVPAHPAGTQVRVELSRSVPCAAGVSPGLAVAQWVAAGALVVAVVATALVVRRRRRHTT